MKKSKRRNSSLKSRRRRSQKVWKMRGCSSRRSKFCAGKSSRRGRGRGKRGGTADVPLAYSNDGNVPSVLNPHYAYTGSPSSGCSTCQTGGSCGGAMCATGQTGGDYVNIPSPLSPLNLDPAPQPPFVGAPWGSQISQWPGVSAPHDGSHLAHNSYNIQPERHPIHEGDTRGPVQLGGRRRRNRKGRKLTKRRMRGGNFGVFSQMGTDLTNAYRAWNGDSALPSPLPYKDQMFFGRTAQDNLNYLKVG
jgi:hypothetical protein